jgi:hypothetical protein
MCKTPESSQNCLMVTLIQTPKLVWFDARFIAASHSKLASKNHIFPRNKRYLAPHGLRYLLS